MVKKFLRFIANILQKIEKTKLSQPKISKHLGKNYRPTSVKITDDCIPEEDITKLKYTFRKNPKVSKNDTSDYRLRYQHGLQREAS